MLLNILEGRNMMLGFIAGLIAKVGAFVASTCEVGCVLLIMLDEPECPKSLIKYILEIILKVDIMITILFIFLF